MDAGFEAVEVVEQAGEFARRGGILDILPPVAQQAIRVEFFGDEVDSIRQFDLDTQRSTDEIKSYDLTAVAAGRELGPSRTTNLLSYLGDQTLVCLADATELAELANTFYSRLSDPTGMYRPEAVFGGLRRLASVEIYPFAAPASDAVDFGIQSLQRLTGGTEDSLGELAELSAKARITVFCETAAEEHRFGEVLAKEHPALAGRAQTAIGHLHAGFHWPAEQLVAGGPPRDLPPLRQASRRLRRVRAGRPIDSFWTSRKATTSSTSPTASPRSRACGRSRRDGQAARST